MTSQLVLINQAGIAVASDTVVTIGGGHEKKTLATADKITDLTGPHGLHRAVALTSGSPRIGKWRWSLLLQEWIVQYSTPPQELSEYAKDFLQWVPRYTRADLAESSAADVIEMRFHEFVEDYFDLRMKQELNAAGRVGAPLLPELKAQLTEAVTRLLQAWQSGKLLPFDDAPDLAYFANFPVDKAVKFLRQENMQKRLLRILNSHLPGWEAQPSGKEWEISSDLMDILTQIAAHLLGIEFGGHLLCPTGLAFAGFGSEDPVGGAVVFNSAGVYLGRAWGTLEPRQPQDVNDTPEYVTMAQSNAIRDFVSGVASENLCQIVAKATEVLVGMAEDARLSLPSGFAKAFHDKAEEEVAHRLLHRYREHFYSTFDALALTPLLHLAQTLVRLQALRSLTGEGAVSVGGAIQGLTIDRERGVVRAEDLPAWL